MNRSVGPIRQSDVRHLAKAIPTARFLALSFILASVAVVMSERVFWFWVPSPAAHLELAAFYALPMAAALLIIARFGVDSTWSLLLVAPAFALVTEGVLTPIVYTGGPLIPLFPAWFTWWHGVMALVFLVFTVRSWLLARRTAALTVAALGLGLFWGIWASTLRLPENVEDEEMIADLGELVVLDPYGFAQYSTTFTLVLIGSHLLVGFVWPERAIPTPWTERVVGALVALGVIGWTFAVPWALPMFVLYLLVPWRALRWHRATRLAKLDGGGPDLFDGLRGRVHPTAAAPLLLTAPTASLTYAGLWAADPSEGILRVIMYGTITVQAIGGAAVTVVAVRRAARRRPVTARTVRGRRWPARTRSGSR